MKKIVGWLLIIVVLTTGSYYGMGYLTERTLNQNIAVINQTNGVFVDLVAYQQGLFTSKAELNVRLHIPEHMIKDANGQETTLPAEDYSLNVPLKVYHGPIIFANGNVRFGLGYALTDLSVPESFKAKYENLFTQESAKPQVHLALFVNYLNKSYLDINLPKFKLISKQDNSEFEWLGMNSQIQISANLADIDGNIHLDGINIFKNKTKAMIGKVITNYDLHKNDLGLYVGKGDIDFLSMVVFNDVKKAMEVENFQLKSGSDVTDGLFNSFTSASLDKFINEDQVYGPAYFDISVKNLDAKTLSQINQQVNKVQQNSSQRQQIMLAILPQLPQLLGHGAQLEIKKLSLVMPDGDVDGNMLLNIPEANDRKPFEMVQSVQGQAHLKIPATVIKKLVTDVVRRRLQNADLQQEMVQQLRNQASKVNTSNKDSTVPTVTSSTSENIKQMVDMQTNEKLIAMQNSGLLVLKNNAYFIDVILKNGEFTINGKLFSSDMMQF